MSISCMPRRRNSRLRRYSLTKLGRVPTTEHIFMGTIPLQSDCACRSAASESPGLRHGGYLLAGLPLDLQPVGGLNRFQQSEMVAVFHQDLYIGHDAMPADNPRKIFDGREEFNLFIKRHPFVVACT